MDRRTFLKGAAAATTAVAAGVGVVAEVAASAPTQLASTAFAVDRLPRQLVTWPDLSFFLEEMFKLAQECNPSLEDIRIVLQDYLPITLLVEKVERTDAGIAVVINNGQRHAVWYGHPDRYSVTDFMKPTSSMKIRTGGSYAVDGGMVHGNGVLA